MGKIRQVPIKWFVVHHSAANDLYTDIEDLVAERARRNEGYNIIIDDEDLPNNGRVRLVQDAPDNEVSNGVYGLNDVSLNFCIDGNFENSIPTEDEINALVQALAVKAKRLNWNKEYARKHIITHNEAGRLYASVKYVTQCPGKNLIALMPEIIERVITYLVD